MPTAALRALNPRALQSLRALRDSGKSGRLSARSESARRELFFLRGKLVGVRTSVDDERLGELLIRAGRITRQQFADASVFVRHGWRLGETLADLGIVNADEVDPMVRRQALEVARAILEAPSTTVSFEETSDLVTTLASPLTVEELLWAAFRRMGDIDAAGRRVRADKRRFGLPVGWDATQCSSLTPEVAYLLSRFHGGTTIEDVVQLSGLGGSQAEGLVVGLIRSGILVPCDERSTAGEVDAAETARFAKEIEMIFHRLEREDAWGVLGLARDVEVGTARDAFRRAVQRFHPDRHPSITDPALRKKLGEVCSQFTSALTCLTTASRLRQAPPRDSVITVASTLSHQRPAPTQRAVDTGGDDSTTPRATPSPSIPTEIQRQAGVEAREPDVYIHHAKRALSEGDYWRATQLLRQAAELRPDDANVHFLLGQALAKNPRWRREAEESFANAISLDPWRTQAYDALRHLYENAGLHRRAARLLDQARELGVLADNPSDAASRAARGRG